MPNSVAIDIWDENPFKNIWHENRPGEIAIMQGAEFEDWRRMLLLLRGYVNAQIKGRERRIVVDECLDFTSETRSVSTRETTFFIVPPALAASVVSALNWARIGFTGFRRSSFTCAPDSTCFIYATTKTCDIFKIAVYPTPNLQREITSSDSTEFSPEEQFPSRIPGDSTYRTGISSNYRNRREM